MTCQFAPPASWQVVTSTNQLNVYVKKNKKNRRVKKIVKDNGMIAACYLLFRTVFS